jgi:hypothetical protein
MNKIAGTLEPQQAKKAQLSKPSRPFPMWEMLQDRCSLGQQGFPVFRGPHRSPRQ